MMKFVLMCLTRCKAPGRDGFIVEFNKQNWLVIKYDIVNAVQYIFAHGKMHKQWNTAAIALAAKVSSPTTINALLTYNCLHYNV